MATVKTGIGASKRDLLKKIGRLKKFVDKRKGEFSPKDRGVFKLALVNMAKAYTFLHKIKCVQLEMSIPFGHYARPVRSSRKARRAR